jgi:predicted nucleotidyltransferase
MKPFNTETVNLILEEVTQWASHRPDISAAALVGSWARGEARVDSDIDLMFVAADPVSFRQDEKWLHEIQWAVVDAEIDDWKDKDYGVIWSRHVFLDNETEIEFGFGLPSWASVNPVDAGTFRMVSEGCRILYDAENLLGKLIDKVKSTQNEWH